MMRGIMLLLSRMNEEGNNITELREVIITVSFPIYRCDVNNVYASLGWMNMVDKIGRIEDYQERNDAVAVSTNRGLNEYG